VEGFTPPGYPWTIEVQQGTNVDFEAKGKTFTSGNGTLYNYVFDRYEFIYHTPIPNATTPIVFVNVQQTDTVVAYFVNKPVNTDTTVFVLLPTAFSPDGDGKNDIFHVVGEQLQDGNLQVYNRWGQKVFESNNPNDYGWNGEFNNKPCQIGVYAYILVGKRLNGDEIKMKGTVTLFR
jgi:gliding motility-associated-like protein